MPRAAAKPPTSKNGRKPKREVSQLGRDLRKISEKIAASGVKLFNRRELRREIAERRGASN